MATWVYCRKTTGTRNKRICWAEQCPKNSEKKKKSSQDLFKQIQEHKH